MFKFKREDCEVLLDYATFMGREVAKGADEQEALAKLQGAIVMFMMIDGLSASTTDYIYNIVFNRYQESFIAYFEDKEEDGQE